MATDRPSSRSIDRPIDRPAVRHVLVVRSVTKCFETASAPVVALDNVSASVPRGALTVIAGPSGSGKSTLLALLSCLDRPDDGEVVLDGVPVHDLSRRRRRALRRTRLGVVLPLPADNLLERYDAAGNLAWAARVRGAGEEGHHERARDALIRDVMARVGLEGAEAKHVRELSGGEQQRLAVACALIGNPSMVVADEPTASLDRVNAASVVTVMRELADRGATLVVASHDAALIEAADQVVTLDHGRRVR